MNKGKRNFKKGKFPKLPKAGVHLMSDAAVMTTQQIDASVIA